MPGSAATVGSMHVCPMCNPGTPPPPHVGGPVSGPGVPTVLIEGKPASVMGDMCTCMGPPDTIVTAESNILIGGKPAATVGSMTAHGGSVTVGAATVLFGTGGSAPTAVMSVKKIPFPEINFALKTMASISGRGAQLREAEAQQQAIRELAESSEGEPKIYNPQWIKEEKEVRKSKVLKQITLRASVLNITDGETITFKVKKTNKTTNANEENTQEDEGIIELSGVVQDQMVEVTWEVEDATIEQGEPSNN